MYNPNRELAFKEDEILTAKKYMQYLYDLEPKANWEMYDLPHHYVLDRMVFKNGKKNHYVEIKNRSHQPDKYDTLILSDKKILWCKIYSTMFRVPTILLVKFSDDSIHYLKINKKRQYETKFYNTKRKEGPTDNTMDHEPMAMLPINEFKRLRDD